MNEVTHNWILEVLTSLVMRLRLARVGRRALPQLTTSKPCELWRDASLAALLIALSSALDVHCHRI